MAMIKCSECGREISEKANVCPGCGAVTLAGLREEKEKEEQKKKDIIEFVDLMFGLIAVIAALVLLFMGLKDFLPDMMNGWYDYKSPLTEHEKEVLNKLLWGAVLLIGVISGGIRKKKKYQTHWTPPDLSNFQTDASSAMWICPDCNKKNKASSYTCNGCGFNRLNK